MASIEFQSLIGCLVWTAALVVGDVEFGMWYVTFDIVVGLSAPTTFSIVKRQGEVSAGALLKFRLPMCLVLGGEITE